MKILNRYTNEVIYEDSSVVSMRDLVSKAVKDEVSLKDASLRNVDISNIDFSKINLSNADLTNSNLSGSCICNSNCQEAEFFHASFSGATLIMHEENGEKTKRYICRE